MGIDIMDKIRKLPPTKVDRETFVSNWEIIFGANAVDKFSTGKGIAVVHSPGEPVFGMECDHTDYACASGICPSCGKEVPDK